MSGWREHKRRALPIVAMCAAGFALTLWVFWPGVQTFDAFYVYKDMGTRSYGDWQSPVMIVLWSLIDPIAPGTGSLLLLTVALYWLAFGVVALTVARRSPALAVVLLLLALSPPAFVFVGIIWRDVLFAIMWLLAAALVFATAECRRLRIAMQIVALALLAFGVLLRPNALAAAPLLAAYILWPSRFAWKRATLLYVPAALALFGLVQVVYYGVLGAARQQPLHSIMVFDLGGISHFAKDNVFPGTWTANQTKLITEGCYNPLAWDAYWTQEPCLFVMEQLERDKLFASPALTEAWKSAILKYPAAYVRHRTTFMATFLAGAENMTMWSRALDDPDKIIFADNPRLMALKAVHDRLKQTPVFYAGTWLLLDLIVCGFAWRRRETPEGLFALGICGSAIVYMMTFYAVGVATDFRYAYWAVLAGMCGTVAVATRRT